MLLVFKKILGRFIFSLTLAFGFMPLYAEVDCNFILSKNEHWKSPKKEVEAFSDRHSVRLESSQFYEVSMQRLPDAIEELSKTSFVELTENSIKYFLPNFQKSNLKLHNKRPFLVRGLFSNFTGRFVLDWDEKKQDLRVMHTSLGKGRTSIWALPLVVFLEKPPKKVIVNIQIAS